MAALACRPLSICQTSRESCDKVRQALVIAEPRTAGGQMTIQMDTRGVVPPEDTPRPSSMVGSKGTPSDVSRGASFLLCWPRSIISLQPKAFLFLFL